MPNTQGAGVRPELTVAAVIERDGRFMFVEERIRGRLLINQPAGHVEPGETLLQAVSRETLEETAWTFLPESMVGIYLWSRGPGQRTFLARRLFRPLRPTTMSIACWIPVSSG